MATEIDEVLKKLEKIQSAERCLKSKYNEMWDDWDGDWDDEYCFFDPNDVLEDVKEAVFLLHKALDHEEYKKGAELALNLSNLKVYVSGDYGQAMRLKDLSAWSLLRQADTNIILKESIELALLGNDKEQQAEAVLKIMDNFCDHSITLENILEMAKEEIDVKAFLPFWIIALASRPASLTDDLLKEAVNMLDNDSLALDVASKYASTHPILYVEILRRGLDLATVPKMLEIGLMGMKEVPEELETRSEICLLTAEYAIRAETPMVAETCWLEAFKSKPNVINYLRVRNFAKDWEKYTQVMRSSYVSYYKSQDSLHRESMPALMFFDTRFGEVIDKFMNPKDGIGWSFTFMKKGIALFLMLLSNKAEGAGIEDMRNIAFHAISFSKEEYLKGTNISNKASEARFFLNCFEKWKEKVSFDDEICKIWLEKLDKWINLRVMAIMKANKRDYYGECAAFIAAHGEVVESRGKTAGKEHTMQKYKALYPQRRKFIAELKNYGMIW